MSCCCLNICCLLPQSNSYFSTRRMPNEKMLQSGCYLSPKNWMRQIKDDVYVSDLNIPGTHESMALHSYFNLSIPVCQRWMLKDQLNSGIRFLDIRIKEDKQGKLPIYHSLANQKAFFEENVINVCDQFLLENPSEFIIMMIRIEDKDKNAPSLSSKFDKIVKKKRDDLFTFDSRIPQIQQIRGKIWIWNGNNWKYKGFGILAQQRIGVLIRQDIYDCTIKEKKSLIEKTFNLSLENKNNRTNGREIYLNQMNGSKWYDWPSSYAAEINKYVYDKQFYEGIIAIDFPGEDLIKQIIDTNFLKKDQFKLQETYLINKVIKSLHEYQNYQEHSKFNRIL